MSSSKRSDFTALFNMNFYRSQDQWRLQREKRLPKADSDVGVAEAPVERAAPKPVKVYSGVASGKKIKPSPARQGRGRGGGSPKIPLKTTLEPSQRPSLNRQQVTQLPQQLCNLRRAIDTSNDLPDTGFWPRGMYDVPEESSVSSDSSQSSLSFDLGTPLDHEHVLSAGGKWPAGSPMLKFCRALQIPTTLDYEDYAEGLEDEAHSSILSVVPDDRGRDGERPASPSLAGLVQRHVTALERLQELEDRCCLPALGPSLCRPGKPSDSPFHCNHCPGRSERRRRPLVLKGIPPRR